MTRFWRWLQQLCPEGDPCHDHWLCYSPSRCMAKLMGEALELQRQEMDREEAAALAKGTE